MVVRLRFVIALVFMVPGTLALSQTEIVAKPGTGTISAALKNYPSGGVAIRLGCGAYYDNVVINDRNDVYLDGLGQGGDCVNLIPQNTSSPAITIEATGAADGGNFIQVRNLYVRCPHAVACGDGIYVTGYTRVSQGISHLLLEDVTIIGDTYSPSTGFANNLHIDGGVLTAKIDHMYSAGGRTAGFNMSSAHPVNQFLVQHSLFQQAYGYGVYWNASTSPANATITFDDSVFQFNGTNARLANCAGFYSSGTGSLNIRNSYFEGNCQGNRADKTYADLRLTGTYNQATSITGSAFFQDYKEWGVYNDTTQTTGVYSGNNFTDSAKSVYVATTHSQSHITLENNFDSAETVAPDRNGDTHESSVSPLGIDSTRNSSSSGISGTTLTLWQQQESSLIEGGATIKNILVGRSGPVAGRLLFLQALSGAPVTLDLAAGGAGQIYGPAGTSSMLLTVGSSVFLYGDGSNWHTISQESGSLYLSNGSQVAGPHSVIGAAALSGGTVTVTLSGNAVFSGNTYVCTGNDTTSTAPVRIVNVSSSNFTITGTGADVIDYSCIGH